MDKERNPHTGMLLLMAESQEISIGQIKPRLSTEITLVFPKTSQTVVFKTANELLSRACYVTCMNGHIHLPTMSEFIE